jgi:hypothetical protein
MFEDVCDLFARAEETLIITNIVLIIYDEWRRDQQLNTSISNRDALRLIQCLQKRRIGKIKMKSINE